MTILFYSSFWLELILTLVSCLFTKFFTFFRITHASSHNQVLSLFLDNKISLHQLFRNCLLLKKVGKTYNFPSVLVDYTHSIPQINNFDSLISERQSTITTQSLAIDPCPIDLAHSPLTSFIRLKIFTRSFHAQRPLHGLGRPRQYSIEVPTRSYPEY